MTVAALPSVASYAENGVTTAFPAPFRFRAPTDLIVGRRAADGTVTVLALGANYSVSGGATDAGGTVTLAAPGPAGGTLIITRHTAKSQDMTYTTGDRFPAASHEAALDKLVLIAQELGDAQEDLGARAVRVPIGETAGTLPPVEERRGKYAAFDVDGDMVPSSGTGADAGLRADLADPALGGVLLRAKLPGVQTVARSLLEYLDDTHFSVKNTGAKGDGLADDTAAFQAAFDHVRLSGGGVVWVPPGRYRITAAIVSDFSGQSDTVSPRVSFVGAGARASIIDIAAGNFDAFTFIGSNGVAADAQIIIENINLNKTGQDGRGFVIKQYSHMSMDNVKVNGCELGIDTVDVQESYLENVIVTFALHGCRLRAGSFTAPNAFTLLNCKMANCLEWGFQAINAASLLILGGSYESNKCSDLTKPSFGICLLWEDDFQIEGTVGLVLCGAYVEQNGHLGEAVTSTGDIWILNNKGPMAVTIMGTSFQRLNNYCRNNIRVDNAGTFPITLTLSGNGHQSFPYDAGYTPSADRPYVWISNPQYARVVDLGNNVYSDDIEHPDFSAFNSATAAAMAQAWGLFDGTGASGAKTLIAGMNVASVAKFATGVYQVNFNRPLKSAAYKPAVQVQGQLRWTVTARTAAYFAIAVTNAAGVAADDGAIGFDVLGGGY